jgi:trigger factor
VRKSYQAPEVSEAEIDQFIERLRTSYATYEPVERPAAEGDMVSVTVSGHLTDPEEGKNPEILENRPLTVVVKPDVEHPEDEWPFPGFAMQLAGHQAGDELTLTHNFSDESPYTTLRGHSAEFHAKIDSIKKMNLPELNDEFAQSVGEFADMAGLRDSVRKGLEANAKEEYDREYFNQLTDQIISGASIKYPPQMLEDEVHSVLDNIEKDLARQNMDLETYLKLRNQEREAFIETEVRPSAVRRLERSLMLDEVARKESIQPDNTEVEATFSQTMAELENTGDIEKLRKQLPMNRLANAVAMEAINRVMNQKVLARLKDIATSEPSEKSETTNQPAAAEAEPAPKKKTRKKAVKATGEEKPEK